MKRQLVLSLFPGADLFGRAFEAEGFCVVRGPDLLMGGDVRNWHVPSGKFDGVIGGPPCQSFSVAVSSAGGADAALHGNLIPEFERIALESEANWYVMENVPGAPQPRLRTNYSEVLDAHAYGAAQHRSRRFTSNLLLHPVETPPVYRHPDPWPCVTATEYKCSAGSNERTMRQRAGRKVGRRLTLPEMREAMGVPVDWAMPALTLAMQYAVLGNGVPLPMGQAIARAVLRCTS